MAERYPVECTGQILAVKPHERGGFGVLVGPGPHVYWFRTPDPPKLGTEVVLGGWTSSVKRMARGTLTMVDDVSIQYTTPPYAMRVVAPEWTKRVQASMSRSLYRYQVQGAAWLASQMVSGKGAILADDPGCIDGDAVVQALRAKRGFKISLRKLHYKFNGGMSGHNCAWDPSFPTYVRALVNGDFHQHRILQVLSRGARSVMKLTLHSGKSLRLTADHEVLTSAGFVPVSSIACGSVVITNGQAACPNCHSTQDLVTYQYAKFRGYCRTCMYRTCRAKPTFKTGKQIDRDGYVWISGQQDHPRQHRGCMPEHILMMEKKLGRYLTADETVHHKNEIKHDNRDDNFELLTHVEHMRLHGRQGGFRHMDGGRAGNGGVICFVPKEDRVVSIEPDGQTDVYDIVCEAPHHNFVANGIVVHNCGKSCQTIAALSATRLYPSVLVCPMSVKLNWAREFQWSKRPPTIAMVSGRVGPLPEADVIIINYDLLAHREQQLTELNARSIIFDEAHCLKEAVPPTLTHRAAVATRLANWFGRAILLTGTPIMNRPRDLWRLLHMVDPEEWPSFADYESRYCRAASEDEDLVGRQARRIAARAGRVERLPELQSRVQQILLRRLKSEVLTDLPPKSRHSILIALDPIDMRAYRAAEKDFIAWLNAQGWSEQARRAAKAQSIVKLTSLRRLAAAAKMRHAVPDYLGQWFDRKAEPLVIFAYHAEIIGALYELCARKLRLRVATIGSKDDVRRRQAQVDIFQNGLADVFLAPITCAGVGINLHRASDALFIERLWTPSLMHQAEDRIHRLGSTRPVTITYFDAAETVDEHLAAVLEAKQRLIEHVLDDPDTVIEASTTIDSILDLYRAA
jgi:SWI/SNF-related matrix-associated actin-dependent regulator 1 of chromatin subfamily A